MSERIETVVVVAAVIAAALVVIVELVGVTSASSYEPVGEDRSSTPVAMSLVFDSHGKKF